MNNIASGVVPNMIPTDAKGASAPQQGSGARSFSSVMQKGEQEGAVSDGSTRPRRTQQPTSDEKGVGVSQAGLEQLRAELSRRLSRMPSSATSMDDVWPDLLRTRTNMGLLREAMKGIDGTPTGTNLKGLFGKVEGEWYNLEQFMKSDKDLSSGELLGLQARLYQVSQHIDVMSKVVDQMTGGIKTILNTNV